MWPRGWGRGIAVLFHDHGTIRVWVVSSTPRPHFTPGKDTVPILQEAGWPKGRSGRAENLVPTGIRSRTVQPVASRYTDWATRPTVNVCKHRKCPVISTLIHWNRFGRKKKCCDWAIAPTDPHTTCCPLPIGPATSSKPRPLYKCHVRPSTTIFHTSHPAFDDGTDRVFRNVGTLQF